MKFVRNAAWSLAGAGLALAAVAAASPAQHAFAPHHPHSELSSDMPFTPARNATASLVSDAKWQRIESMAALPNYQLRIKQPKLCDANTTQYS
ncbi:hypothetical protein IWW35_004745, partial [Coemansia sp. RSA 1878]